MAAFLPEYRRLLIRLEGACQAYCPCHCGLDSGFCHLLMGDYFPSVFAYCPGEYDGNLVTKRPATRWHWAQMFKELKDTIERFEYEQMYSWENYPEVLAMNNDSHKRERKEPSYSADKTIWLNSDEAARFLGYSEQTLAAWRRMGKGPSFDASRPNVRLYRLDVLKAFYAEHGPGRCIRQDIQGIMNTRKNMRFKPETRIPRKEKTC